MRALLLRHRCCGHAPCRAALEKLHRIELIPAGKTETVPNATGSDGAKQSAAPGS